MCQIININIAKLESNWSFGISIRPQKWIIIWYAVYILYCLHNKQQTTFEMSFLDICRIPTKET